MFKKEDQDFKEVETIIGPSVKVEGDFVGHGNLVIEGVVKGSVKTEGNLKVGEKSQVSASVSAANAIISGEIKGSVSIAGDLELTASAKIWGDISAKSICIARGAFLTGNCNMTETGKNNTAKEIETAEEESDVL